MRGEGPLLVLVQQVEQVLQGMRGRMEERGKRIVALQQRLRELSSSILGMEWLKVELEEEDEVNKGWEGLDLKLDRMSALERELVRCETEIVSLVLPFIRSLV